MCSIDVLKTFTPEEFYMKKWVLPDDPSWNDWWYELASHMEEDWEYEELVIAFEEDIKAGLETLEFFDKYCFTGREHM